MPHQIVNDSFMHPNIKEARASFSAIYDEERLYFPELSIEITLMFRQLDVIMR